MPIGISKKLLLILSREVKKFSLFIQLLSISFMYLRCLLGFHKWVKTSKSRKKYCSYCKMPYEQMQIKNIKSNKGGRSRYIILKPAVIFSLLGMILILIGVYMPSLASKLIFIILGFLCLFFAKLNT